MKPLGKILSSLLPLLAPSLRAVDIDWSFGGVDNLWSNPGNWAGGVVPDGNDVNVSFLGAANVAIDVDGNYTIQSYLDGFGGPGFTHTLYSSTGMGSLTIDSNSSTTALGINNGTGPSGGTLRFNGDLIIDNSDASGAVTTIRNSNSAGNILLFDNNCRLTLLTRLQTIQGVGGDIFFDCTFLPSDANLLIGSNNVSFGPGHSSANFGQDIVLFSDAKLAIDGGTVLNTGRKFQINGSGAELELNAADAINDANVIVGGTNSLLLDVNTNQPTMGVVSINDGTLTIDLDPAVTNLSFKNSAAQAWGAGGTVTITGFEENTIRFGTDDTGLTASQLAAIDGGAYFLTADGYLSAGAVEVPTLDLVLDPFPKISFPTVNGQTYQLQKSSDMSPGSWDDVIGEFVTGDGTEKTLSDSAGGPPGETRAFYRVETE